MVEAGLAVAQPGHVAARHAMPVTHALPVPAVCLRRSLILIFIGGYESKRALRGHDVVDV